jgi:hypothetical protein
VLHAGSVDLVQRQQRAVSNEGGSNSQATLRSRLRQLGLGNPRGCRGRTLPAPFEAVDETLDLPKGWDLHATKRGVHEGKDRWVGLASQAQRS